MIMRIFSIIIILAAAAAGVAMASSGVDAEPVDGNGVNCILAELLADDGHTANPWDSRGISAPDGGCVRLHVRPIGGSLGHVLNDRNEMHMASARSMGIRPMTDLASAWSNSRGLFRISSCGLFWVDTLKYSYPYLTREARDLLVEITERFRDTLAVRGGGSYRPKVTSLLRSPASVSRLRRVNRNAVGESAHQYGTTFDLSYSKFICDNLDGPARTFEDLKNLLGEIVASMRAEGRCLVKHERRQACFHITVASGAPGAGAGYNTDSCDYE